MWIALGQEGRARDSKPGFLRKISLLIGFHQLLPGVPCIAALLCRQFPLKNKIIKSGKFITLTIKTAQLYVL
jgi:hypothetical protein